MITLPVVLLQNWKVVIGTIAMVIVVTYAGVQKVRADSYHDDIYNPDTGYQVKLKTCKGALKDVTDAVDLLKTKSDELDKDLLKSNDEAGKILQAREKRIESLLLEAKANDCKGNLERFQKQLRGQTWFGE